MNSFPFRKYVDYGFPVNDDVGQWVDLNLIDGVDFNMLFNHHDLQEFWIND